MFIQLTLKPGTLIPNFDACLGVYTKYFTLSAMMMFWVLFNSRGYGANGEGKA